MARWIGRPRRCFGIFGGAGGDIGRAGIMGPAAPRRARGGRRRRLGPWPAVRSGPPAATPDTVRPGERAARTTAGSSGGAGYDIVGGSGGSSAEGRSQPPVSTPAHGSTGVWCSGGPTEHRRGRGRLGRLAPGGPARQRRRHRGRTAPPGRRDLRGGGGFRLVRGVCLVRGAWLVRLVRGFRLARASAAPRVGLVRGYGWGGRLVGDRRIPLRLRARGAPVGRPCSRLGLRHRGNLLSRRSEVSTASPPSPTGRSAVVPARDRRRANAYPWAS